LQVELSPLAVLERLAVDLDGLNVAVAAVPVDVDVGVAESKELVAALRVTEPAAEVILKSQLYCVNVGR
jgi:hypothetical protein